MRDIVLIAHNIRSTHNVGSLLRTAEGLGVTNVILSGYTPYPKLENDNRLPHISNKLSSQIQKTALGAENFQNWRHSPDIFKAILDLKTDGYEICALEQTKKAIKLGAYEPAKRTALIVGSEVDGLEPQVLKLADVCIEIPMFGKKESFNVAVAAGIAVYSLRFNPVAVRQNCPGQIK